MFTPHKRTSSRSSWSGKPRTFSGARFGGQRSRAMFNPTMLVKKAVIEPEEVFVPQHSFSDFGFDPQLLKNILAKGYEHPTPIQDQTIPALLSGKDLIGLANTGTGKTAAFLLPLIQKLLIDQTADALIVAPTRELAVQIEQEFRDFAQGLRLYSALCIGGVRMGGQVVKLRRGVDVVIGTPGRLRDLCEQGILRFDRFKVLVLDEVDRMMDMGFVKEVRYIEAQLPKPRQTIFFSATTTPPIRQLMQTFLTNPVEVSVKTREAASNVNQDVVKLAGRPKMEVLHELLIQEEFVKVLVFSRTKHGAEKISNALGERGFRVGALHGNKNQNQRQRVIEMFKSDRLKVLVATDVASRGLDIQNISHVINFDLPETYEDYIHRIGRTGRASQTGIALTLVD